jgi:predicted NBD/HSP70 family sugar kinase
VEPARQRDLRTSNHAGVLGAVADSPEPVSRARLAARTGLTRTTVSALVEPLLSAGLLAETGPAPRAGAGRPAVGLRLSGERVAALGAEVGVDYLAACVLDLTGAVRCREVVLGDNRADSPEATLARSAALAARLLDRSRAQGLEVVGGTWAVPGLVDAARGRVLLAPNLGWSGVDAVDLLTASPHLVGLPLDADNEATLAAVAELGHPPRGLARGNLLRVSGEVGIGAGVVLEGRLVRGEHGWSGELGHVTIDPAGPRCRCGATGCLEVYAGQEALLRAAGRTAPATTTLGEGGSLAALVDAAEAGDPATLAALARAGTALGLALAAAVNLLDVDAVVLGGIYAPLQRWIRPGVEAELATRVLRARLRPVAVTVSTTGPDAAVLGAAARVLQGVLARPARLLAPAGW